MFSRVCLFLVFGSFLSQIACDQSVDQGLDKMSEGQQRLVVSYKGAQASINFDDVETVMLAEDQPVIYLDDLVLGSGLVLSVDSLWFSFVGSDGLLLP